MSYVKRASVSVKSLKDVKLVSIENLTANFVVEAGAAMVTVHDLPKLNIGSVIELNRLANEHLEIRISGALSPASSPINSTDKR